MLKIEQPMYTINVTARHAADAPPSRRKTGVSLRLAAEAPRRCADRLNV